MALKRATDAQQERCLGYAFLKYKPGLFEPLLVGRRGDCEAVWLVRVDEAVTSADLGGSSNYSNENFED